MFFKNSTSFKGFSLAEMLIVFSIVGIITAVVFGSVKNSRTTARDLSRLSDMKEVQIGLALYFNKYRAYPASLNSLVVEGNIPAIPTNPLGSPYEYQVASNNKSYCLGALMENSRDYDGFTDCAVPSSSIGSTDLWYKTANSQ
jgi:prepilin-type N-terminal cleavage/methylation domain-containing protein